MASTLVKHLGLLAGRRPGLREGEALPAIRVEREAAWDRARLDAYRRVTGLADDGALPLLAPQVMAVGLHLDLFADARFPFKALGLVHVENTVVCERAAPETASLQLAASVENARPGPGGTLFDLVTAASDREGPLGTWTTTILARSPAAKPPAKPPPRPPPRPMERKADAPMEGALVASLVASAPEDIGRRYAAVAGDLNPIHQRAILARVFGFPRAIAHGMWTLARVLAETSAYTDGRPRLHARFRKPLFLPGRFVIEARRRDDGAVALAALPAKGGTAHLVAEVSGRP